MKVIVYTIIDGSQICVYIIKVIKSGSPLNFALIYQESVCQTWYKCST